MPPQIRALCCGYCGGELPTDRTVGCTKLHTELVWQKAHKATRARYAREARARKRLHLPPPAEQRRRMLVAATLIANDLQMTSERFSDD